MTNKANCSSPIKRIILIVALALLFCGICLASNVYASSYKEVSDSDFPKLTEGKLTKEQVETVLNVMIDFCDKDIVLSKLTKEEINKLGQRAYINQATLNIEEYKFERDEEGKDTTSYPLKKVNNCLSFYTDHRFPVNSYEKDERGMVWRTDEKKYYYYAAYGTIATGCRIQSAKENGYKMIVKFIQGHDFLGESGINYTAILKKQDDGRYMLDSIYVPGNYKRFKSSNLVKVTRGAINKKQFKAIVGTIIKRHGLKNVNTEPRKKISHKKIKRIGKNYYTVEKIIGRALDHNKKNGWYYYSRSKSNKLLSFFSDNRIKKNKRWNGNGLKWRSTSKKIRYNKKTKNSYKLTISKAYKNSKHIKIWVNYEVLRNFEGYAQPTTEAIFVVKLKQLSGKKYSLYDMERLGGWKSN